MRHRLLLFVAFALLPLVGRAGIPGTLEPPPPPPAGFAQIITPACIVETDLDKSAANRIALMVQTAERKFYELFKLTPALMNGVSKEKFDFKFNIPGTIMADMGFRPWVEIRVFKEYEKYSDEWFELIDVKDKVQRLRQGVPGAYFSVCKDYDNKRWLRRIRSFVANRDDDELERTLLHEMGHLYMKSYLLEFFGDPPRGRESEKRGTPSWLQEGLAQLFENLWSKAASAQKARARQQAMIYEAIKLGDAYNFDDFINITNAHNLAAVANDPLKMTINYAQSASVMDYMVHVDGTRFFDFLQTLRALNLERNLRAKDKNHIPELYSFQNEAFKKAFNADLKVVEDFWKKDVKTKMETSLKRQPELYYWIGEYYLRRNKDKAADYAKAEENFNLAMTQAPTKGEGYLGMGRMTTRKANMEKDAEARQKLCETAMGMLAKATEYLPKDDDAWYYYGASQVNCGKYKEACDSFAKSVALYARNARALAGLGQSAFASAQYEKAMDAYEKAYEASRDPRYLFEKGHAAFFAKKYRDAQGGFARFCEMFPKDAYGQLWYGLAAWRLDDKKFGLEKLEEAFKLNPGNPLAKQAVELARKGETIKFELETAEVAVAKTPAGDKKPPKPPPVRMIDEE
jgi:tetratricopeptide (TPR) repeat protein